METVLVPDYFEQFHCKCGACRHPCCDGWGINVSEHEYYSLLGLACSQRLRNKLDDAFVLEKQATEERYASIRPNYLEQCPMLDEDGLCLLQKEEGEGVLPLICRVYPRAVKKYGDHCEICMSCSCEATIEVLMQSKKPLTLHKTAAVPPFEGLTVYGDEPEKERVRRASVALMSDASRTIGERIGEIGEMICGESAPVRKSRGEALSSLLKLLEMVCRGSQSMRICGEKVLAFFDGAAPAERLARFDGAEKHLYRLIPDIEQYAGRIIANHMLFESFPYIPDCTSPDTAFAAFCTAVALLKLLCVGGMAESGEITDFTDILAFANRFIEHSDFYRICSRLDHPRGMETFAGFAEIFERA